jgi:hypothetical protein
MASLDMAFVFIFLTRVMNHGIFRKMPEVVSAQMEFTGPHNKLLGTKHSFTIAVFSTAFFCLFQRLIKEKFFLDFILKHIPSQNQEVDDSLTNLLILPAAK